MTLALRIPLARDCTFPFLIFIHLRWDPSRIWRLTEWTRGVLKVCKLVLVEKEETPAILACVQRNIWQRVLVILYLSCRTVFRQIHDVNLWNMTTKSTIITSSALRVRRISSPKVTGIYCGVVNWVSTTSPTLSKNALDSSPKYVSRHPRSVNLAEP
jgi:hypothetical protein